jgi:hypothetical protein
VVLLPKLLASVGDGPEFNVERVTAIGSLGVGTRSATPALMRLLQLNLESGGEIYRAVGAARALAQLEAAGPPQAGVEALLLKCFSRSWNSEALLNAMMPLANSPGQVRERLLHLMMDPRFDAAARIAFEVNQGSLPLTKEQHAGASKLTTPQP